MITGGKRMKSLLLSGKVKPDMGRPSENLIREANN